MLPEGYVTGSTTATTGTVKTKMTTTPAATTTIPTATDCDVKGDVTIATIEMFEYLKARTVLQGAAARKALVAWLGLLEAAHLVPSCADGAGEALRVLERAWPVGEDGILDLDAWKGVRICGDEVRRPYVSCVGSTPETRGYTCGLWMLFHSTSVRMPAGRSAGHDGHDDHDGAWWLGVVEGYIQHFFQCADCAEHFLDELHGADAKEVRSKRDAVLWLWKTHNRVNARLVREDAAGTNRQDPVFPHVQWPLKEVCGGCYDSRGGWDEEGVLEFLFAQYYGTKTTTAALGGATTARKQSSSWFQALMVVCIVIGLVYSSLKKNNVQYGGRFGKGGVGSYLNSTPCARTPRLSHLRSALVRQVTGRAG